MNKPLALFVTGLVALGCLSSAAIAQKKTRKKHASRTSGDTLRNYMLKKGQPVVVEDPGESYQPGTDVPMNKRVAVKGLGKFVQPFVGTDPGRLAPGQSGELRIILALKGVYVFEDGLHLTLRYRREQGQVSFGNWHLLPAHKGKLDTVYQGLQVYDNTATIVIPISIGGSAGYGEKTVGFEVEADVTNGKTGIFWGRHTMDVRGKVVVGPPLPVIQDSPDDDFTPDAAPIVGATASDRRAGVAEPATLARAADARPATLTAADGTPMPGSSNARRPDGEDLGVAEDGPGGVSILLYAVPGALLLLLLAMALGKGRK